MITNLWRTYGLRSDPYFQEPLTPELGAVYPISLFVGRERELALVANQVLGAVSTRAVVQGAPGVGKTSFVNCLKATLAEHGVLTHDQPVRAMCDMTPNALAAEVLRVLIQIHDAGRGTSDWTDRDEGRFWRRIGRQVEGEDTMGGGMAAAGFGVSVTQGRIAAERRDLSLYNEVAQAVAYLTSPPVARDHEQGPRRVLIHVNNLENLSRACTRGMTGISDTSCGC